MISSPVHIMLADDDRDDCNLFRIALQEIETKTVLQTFEDGEDLLIHLETETIVFPDIILLDINMPKKTGIECLVEIRNSDKLKHLPVLMYSTSFSLHDIEKSFSLGANMYIVKPFEFEQLIKTVNHITTIDWEYQKKVVNLETFLFEAE